MEITTILGMVIGFGCVAITIVVSGSLGDYWDVASVFIVFGGVIGATIASYPMSMLKNLVKVMATTFQAKKVDLAEDIEMMIGLANIARREGILALEETASTTEDLFLKKGIMLIIDGCDPELVRNVMETEMDFVTERHNQGQAVLLSMSSYSPAFGMAGTLVGLINMLKELDDMAALGPNMAVALVTTFYGVILANLVFTPMAKKLKAMDDEESLRKGLILEGILSIQEGENPRIIREKLNAFLSNTQLRTVSTGRKEAEDELR